MKMKAWALAASLLLFPLAASAKIDWYIFAPHTPTPACVSAQVMSSVLGVPAMAGPRRLRNFFIRLHDYKGDIVHTFGAQRHMVIIFNKRGGSMAYFSDYNVCVDWMLSVEQEDKPKTEMKK